MGDSETGGGDLLGIRPLADSVHTVTKGAVAGAAAFLSRICLPAAEEFGLLLRDRVSAWRAANTTSIAQKAERLLRPVENSEALHAHPRLVAQIVEQGSWLDADDIQEMWAGLLASSCTSDGSDDSNLIFVDLLSRMTIAQARILEQTCTTCSKTVTSAGWIQSEEVMTLAELQVCTGIDDFHRIDRELDYLRTLGLIDGGFDVRSTDADVTPTALALQMYVRCHGHSGDPLTFFGISRPEKAADEPAG